MSMLLPIGIDIGYGYTEAINGLTRSIIALPSAVTRVDKAIEGATGNYADSTGRYHVGEDAVRYGVVDQGSIDSTWIFSPTYRVLAMHAIAQVTDPCDVLLVTGLPVEFYDRDKKALRQSMLSWKKGKLNISHAIVVPQPMGSLYDVSNSWSGEKIDDFRERRVGVIDIGHGTIDALESMNDKIVPSALKGRSWGVSMLHQEVYAHIVEKFGAGYRIQDVNGIIRAGHLYHAGEKKSLEKAIAKAKANFLSRLKVLVNETWPKGTDPLYRIIFTGGGAELLREEILKAYPKGQVVIPEDAQEANARGFAKIAAAYEASMRANKGSSGTKVVAGA